MTPTQITFAESGICAAFRIILLTLILLILAVAVVMALFGSSSRLLDSSELATIPRPFATFIHPVSS